MQNNDLGQKIKEYRTSKNMTQLALAKVLGIKKSTISAYENGVIEPPVEKLKVMANIFNVTVNSLVGKKESHVLDISDLNEEQRASIIQTVTVYRNLNKVIDGYVQQSRNAQEIRVPVVQKIEEKVLKSQEIKQLAAK